MYFGLRDVFLSLAFNLFLANFLLFKTDVCYFINNKKRGEKTRLAAIVVVVVVVLTLVW